MAEKRRFIGPGGGVFVPNVDDETIRQKIKSGEWEPVSGWDDSSDGLPAASAKVAVWRSYAVDQGMDPDEAKGSTKADLMARFAADDDDGSDAGDGPAGPDDDPDAA